MGLAKEIFGDILALEEAGADDFGLEDWGYIPPEEGRAGDVLMIEWGAFKNLAMKYGVKI